MFNRLTQWGAAVARTCCTLLFASTAIALSPNAYAGEVRLSSSHKSVQLGDTFTLSLGIYGLKALSGDSLSAFDLRLDFEAHSASFVGSDFVDAHSGVNALDLPESGAFAFLGDATLIQPGRISAFGLSGNSESVLDALQAADFVFLNLHFRALAEDTAAEFSLDLQDSQLLFVGSDNMPLNPGFGNNTLSLQFGKPGQQVPEPPMLSLVCGALLLAGLRRRAGALALTGLALNTGVALAVTPPPTPMVAAVSPATVDALIVEVQGQRLKLLDAQGRETWYTLRHTPQPGLAGKRIQGQVSAQGDSLVLEPTRID
ncbi:MAG: hypothetical protein ACOVLH_07140 [Roseateles sp.]